MRRLGLAVVVATVAVKLFPTVVIGAWIALGDTVARPVGRGRTEGGEEAMIAVHWLVVGAFAGFWVAVLDAT